MKKLILLLSFVISISVMYSQLPQNARLIAGALNYSEYTNVDDKYYIAEILKPQGDSLVTDMVLCDSMEYLQRLYYYPYYHRISVWVTQKENAHKRYAFGREKIISLDTRNMDTIENYLPEEKIINQKKYFLGRIFYLLLFSDTLKYSTYYYRDTEILNYILNPETGKEKINTQLLFPNYIGGGSSTCVYCTHSTDYIFFRTDTTDNKLHFYHALDQGALFPIPLSKSYQKNLVYAYVSVDNPKVMVLNFLYEDGTFKCRVLNKKNQKWNEFTVNSSVNYKENIMHFQNYGNWLTGKRSMPYPNIQIDNFIGQKQWKEIETPYSRKIEEVMYYDGGRYGLYPRYYSDGILYLYNINTEKMIEWDTQQVDSEILNVKNDTVYYRVYDEIFSVPIINQKKLGTPKLLIKHDFVTGVHYMFFKGE